MKNNAWAVWGPPEAWGPRSPLDKTALACWITSAVWNKFHKSTQNPVQIWTPDLDPDDFQNFTELPFSKIPLW